MDKKISQLPVAGAITSDDLIVINQQGATKTIPFSAIPIPDVPNLPNLPPANPGNAAKYLDGVGTWTIPGPNLPNLPTPVDASKFLNGAGSWVTPNITPVFDVKKISSQIANIHTIGYQNRNNPLFAIPTDRAILPFLMVFKIEDCQGYQFPFPLMALVYLSMYNGVGYTTLVTFPAPVGAQVVNGVYRYNMAYPQAYNFMNQYPQDRVDRNVYLTANLYTGQMGAGSMVIDTYYLEVIY
jgi:hypothetical protein